jgi:aspartate/methionine/tyrosine aminotransferase
MSYLRWIKQKTESLRGRSDVINLAGSAVEVPEAHEWFARALREQGRPLYERWAACSNEFGLAELKERIRAAYQAPTSRDIALTNGSSGAIRLTYEMLLAGKPGQHWVVEQPYYEPLASMATRMGARVELAPRGAGYDFAIEVLQRATLETAAVVLTNPHNPTGHWLPRADVGKLAEALMKKSPQACVIIDETFGDLAPTDGARHEALHERIITINGLTKCYGLGALRCGWVTADRKTFPRLIDDWIEFEDIGCKLTELLAADALERLAEWRGSEALSDLEVKRLAVGVWIDEQADRGLLGSTDLGKSSVVFPRWLGKTPTLELAELLLRDYGVLIAPGEFFRPVEGMAFRIGLGGDAERLREGLKRLRNGLQALG